MKKIIKNNSIIRFIVVMVSVLLVVSMTFIQPSYAASKPAKVGGLTVSARTYSSVTVKWKKAKRAKKYQIGYKIAGGKWKYKTVKSKYKSKKITGLSQYRKYSFRVRGIKGKKKGKWSTTVTTYTCPKYYAWPELPKVASIEQTKCRPGSMDIKWAVEYPEDARVQTAQVAIDAAQAKVNEIQLKIDEANQPPIDDIVEPEPQPEVEDLDSEMEEVVDPQEEETTPEEPDLQQQLEAAQAELDAANEVLVKAKSIKTNYKNCAYRIYRSTNNKNWSLYATVSNGTRSYACRRCDAGVRYYFRVVPVDTTTYVTFTHEGAASESVSGVATGIPGLNFKVQYTTRNKSYVQNWKYTTRGLMLHSVGCPVAKAETFFNTYNQKNYNKAAVHAFIDGDTGVAWQFLPWTMRGGHAGKLANDQYVGIEMCESPYIKYKSGTKFTIKDRAKAVKSAELTYNQSVKLFAYLCDYFGINPQGTFTTKKDNGKTVTVHTIMSHDEWRRAGHDGHYDPEHYWKGLGLNNDGIHNYTMNKFRSDVTSTLNANK